MPRSQRSEQFDSGEVCIVHTVQRCVRRAFLAGLDQAVTDGATHYPLTLSRQAIICRLTPRQKFDDKGD